MRVRPSDDICPTSAAAAQAPTEAEARAAFVSRASGAAVDAAELLGRIASAGAARVGLLEPVPEDGLAQFPLRAWRATVADPVRTAGGPTAVVTGHGGDPEAARLAAVLAGLAGYGMLAVDRRRLVQPDGEAIAWGVDLVTGALRRVPAEDVFPAADGRTPLPVPTGAAAGLTWVDALESGLAQHVEALLARRLADPATRVPRLDLSTCDSDDPGARVLRLLDSAGELAAHDLSGLLSVPACAIRIGPDTVIATGASPSCAVRGAAQRALALWQSRTAISPDPVPVELPVVARITPEREAPAAAHRDPSGPVRWARPDEALRSQGKTPVAVLLDHDPQAVLLLPYVVRVVLIDE